MRETEYDSLIRLVTSVLEEEKCPYALIGAMAMVVHDAPRATLDVDFLTTEAGVLRIDWPERMPEDVKVDVRRGEHDDPLAGVITFERGVEPVIDVIVGRWKWQEAAISRAVPVDLRGVSLPVIGAADLVVLKLDAGGPRDRLDIEFLFERLGEPLANAVRERIPELPETLQRDCEELVRRTWE